MTVVRDFHEQFSATFTSVDGREVPLHYGRPERTHRAVRNGVGVTEMDYDVLVATGPDRVDAVDAALVGDAPTTDGTGGYGLLLDGGTVAADCYAYGTDERLLLFCAPGTGTAVADAVRAAGDDVAVEPETAGFGVFGVHGPNATEKLASVLHGAGAPDGRLTFDRGEVGDAGVTVVRGDGLAGEEGYEVVCRAADAEAVLETLVTLGLNAVPFGRRTWDTLTLEAGTPLLRSELAGHSPAACGLGDAGGDPATRLVGLSPDAVPDAGATVRADGDRVGTVTRAAEGPSRGAPVALAHVDATALDGALTVEAGGESVAAPVADLPFVAGSERSARVPTY